MLVKKRTPLQWRTLEFFAAGLKAAFYFFSNDFAAHCIALIGKMQAIFSDKLHKLRNKDH